MRYSYLADKAEMERRHKAVLAAMEKEDIDCLIVAAKNPELYGAARYLTNLPFSNYPYLGMFSKDGVFIYAHGAQNPTCPAPKHLGLETAGGLAYPYIESVSFWDDVYPSEMAKDIRSHNYRKIGFVGMGYLPANVYKYLTENLDSVEFTDATLLLDKIKAVKSEYELKGFMNCVRIHDALAAAVPSVLIPGRKEKDVLQDLRYLADGLGCEELNIMMGSDPTHPALFTYKYASRTLQPGDLCRVLIEVATQGGYWGHIGRIYSLGEPSAEYRRIMDDTIAMQDLVAEKCVPGVTGQDLFRLLNDNLSRLNYKPEARLFAHSQSYDIADRPFFLEGDDMELCENMFLAIHPNCVNAAGHGYICDNYLLKKEGAVRLNKTERGVIVIDI